MAFWNKGQSLMLGCLLNIDHDLGQDACLPPAVPHLVCKGKDRLKDRCLVVPHAASPAAERVPCQCCHSGHIRQMQVRVFIRRACVEDGISCSVFLFEALTLVLSDASQSASKVRGCRRSEPDRPPLLLPESCSELIITPRVLPFGTCNICMIYWPLSLVCGLSGVT